MAAVKLWGVRAALQFLHRTNKPKEDTEDENEAQRNEDNVLANLFAHAKSETKDDPNDPDDEFIDCGPSPPVDEVPFIFDHNYEHPNNENEVKICYHTIEQNILEHMENVFGRTSLLNDIQSKKINQKNN